MAEGQLRVSQVRALVRLLNEAHEVGRAERPRHLLAGMRRILGAAVGACVLDRDFGPGGHGYFTAIVLDGWDDSTLTAIRVLGQNGSAFNPSIRALMKRRPEAGAIITATRRELIGDRTWYDSPFLEHHVRPAHLDDSLYSIHRTGVPSVVQGLGFYRGRNEPPFDEADRELMHLFHAECGWMLDMPELTEDERLRAQLSPRERQTLELLLSGLADKDIAGQLGISRFTVNQYTKSLYRRFGVRARAELISRLLAPQAPARASRAPLPAS